MTENSTTRKGWEMSISKEIFKIEKQDLSDCPMGLRDYGHGFNDALNAIDEHELSEEELVNIITSEYYPHDERATLVARQIKQNQHRIFVRKNK